MTPSEAANGGDAAIRRTVLAAAAFYLCFSVAALAIHGGDVRWFLWIGDKFADRNPGGRSGYDGQFVYYIARDGMAAATHLDNPPYRLTRIFLPLAARLLSFGRADLVPWAIVGINLASIVGTTWLLARWLAANGASPWLALAYAFYVGTFLAYSRALTEPLAFFLAAAGTVAWLRGRAWHGVGLLALAALTKEIAVVFSFGLAAAALMQRRFAAAAGVLTSMLPLVLWSALLYRHFAAVGYRPPRGALLTPIPLGGAFAAPAVDLGYVSAFVAVALPAILLLPVAVVQLRADRNDVPCWLVLAHCVWILLLPAAVYGHVMSAGRNGAGLAVALLLAMPLGRSNLPLTAAALGAIPTIVWLPPVLLWSPWGPPLKDTLRSLIG